MWRLIGSSLALLAVLMPGCKRSTDVVDGGVYAFAGPDGEYTISKVLVSDESAVHLRSYKESFKAVPSAIDTSKLTVFIGHAPIAREGFLKDQPKLITVEKVAESELDGYRYYQEAMGAAH
jgi:hypothetical protein